MVQIVAYLDEILKNIFNKKIQSRYISHIGNVSQIESYNSHKYYA